MSLLVTASLSPDDAAIFNHMWLGSLTEKVCDGQAEWGVDELPQTLETAGHQGLSHHHLLLLPSFEDVIG